MYLYKEYRDYTAWWTREYNRNLEGRGGCSFFCVDSLCTAVAQDNVQKTTLNDVRTVCVAKIFHECSPFLIIPKFGAILLDK